MGAAKTEFCFRCYNHAPPRGSLHITLYHGGNKMSVVVVLEIRVNPEALDEMKAFRKKNLPDTRASDGCQGIDIYGNVDDTGNLVLYERWDSRHHDEKYRAWRTET